MMRYSVRKALIYSNRFLLTVKIKLKDSLTLLTIVSFASNESVEMTVIQSFEKNYFKS